MSKKKLTVLPSDHQGRNTPYKIYQQYKYSFRPPLWQCLERVYRSLEYDRHVSNLHWLELIYSKGKPKSLG